MFSLSIYAVLSQNPFLQFTHFCVEKNLAKNSARGEKLTNIRYVSATICLHVSLFSLLNVHKCVLNFGYKRGINLRSPILQHM